MAPHWRLLLLALSATRFSTLFGARLSMKSLSPNAKEATPVNSYAAAVQTAKLVMFDEPEVTNETTTKVMTSQEGCEKAVKYKRGKLTDSGDDIFTWECLRCRVGYIEDIKMVSVPPSILEKYKNVQGKTTQNKRICTWKPGGSLCFESGAKSTTMHQKLMGGYDSSCLKCYPPSVGRAVLVDTNIKAVDPNGKDIVIKKICSPVVATTNDDLTYSKALMEKLMSKFDGVVPAGILQIIQIADEFRMKATQTFLAGARTDAEKHEKDMVGDGSKFLQLKVEHAIEEARSADPERLTRIARSFVESGKLQEIRGALDLCFSVAMKEMDGTERDSQYINAGKGCRSTDYVFVVMLDIFCKQILDSPKCNAPYPDWESPQEAPRQAIEILRMFGAIQ